MTGVVRAFEIPPEREAQSAGKQRKMGYYAIARSIFQNEGGTNLNFENSQSSIFAKIAKMDNVFEQFHPRLNFLISLLSIALF
jgi:hypothetical protein